MAKRRASVHFISESVGIETGNPRQSGANRDLVHVNHVIPYQQRTAIDFVPIFPNASILERDKSVQQLPTISPSRAVRGVVLVRDQRRTAQFARQRLDPGSQQTFPRFKSLRFLFPGSDWNVEINNPWHAPASVLAPAIRFWRIGKNQLLRVRSDPHECCDSRRRQYE